MAISFADPGARLVPDEEISWSAVSQIASAETQRPAFRKIAGVTPSGRSFRKRGVNRDVQEHII